MTPLRNTSALLAGTAALCLAAPLHAQAGQPAKDESAPGAREAARSDDPSDQEILVTGTRIRGVRATGEVTVLDRDAIVAAGQVDLGEAMRSLPQNFSGGQNPGVGSGAGLINTNIGSGASANLRGLGPDATLTLLNGHRLPYNSAFQGVDISAIPLAAVERIEVVPDGASALYGSDAVGGVVNVLLRRDFEGIATSAQIGTSTDGGNFRQQADMVGGTAWSGGGLMLAYDFANNSAIRADQRSYAGTLRPASTLFPSMERHAVTMSAHHRILPGAKANIDALYSRRDSTVGGGTAALSRSFDAKLEGFTVAPSVRIDLGPRWEARLTGIFGRDRTRFQTTLTPLMGLASRSSGYYYNAISSLEASLEGPLFALPGGDVRLAAGAGLRDSRLENDLEGGAYDAAFDVERGARFGFAELYLPLVSPANAVPGIAQLTVSGAVRYEDYPGLDQLATPRIGVTYAPVEGLTLRGSWARSFKAPTLYQQHVFYEAILLPAAAFGAGTGADTVLLAAGGNPDLKPERARSWTAGLDFRPGAIPGLLVSLTWYDIAYNDRVTIPIAGRLSTAFADPGYASLIDRSPAADALAALIASAQGGLQNYTGSAYASANVVALVDNRNINVATWSIEGVDARIAWERRRDADHGFGFDLTASWIDSKQRITAALPQVDLSGRIFNPASLRMRGTAHLDAGRLGANVALNYTGDLLDPRFAADNRLSPSASIDVGLNYTVLGERAKPGLQVSLTVQNLLNKKPETIGQTGPTDTPVDSTNYSPIGRFIAFGIRRHW